MIEEPSAPATLKSGVDYRLLVPFLSHVILAQMLILVVRITTSYRTIELGLPIVWLGIIATGFAFLMPASESIHFIVTQFISCRKRLYSYLSGVAICQRQQYHWLWPMDAYSQACLCQWCC